VFINPDDANKLNFKKLDKIDLLSNYNGIKRRAKNFLIIPYNIPRGNLAAYFPETNILIPHDEYADKSNTPISKSVKVTIESANS
jgi:anaerobic selenocysteine-containing dehydrogenase